MQLVVPEVLSLLCAKLVKAMAALISLQYVSSLPFIFSFCTTATPPLSLMKTRVQRERTEERVYSATAASVLDHLIILFAHHHNVIINMTISLQCVRNF